MKLHSSQVLFLSMLAILVFVSCNKEKEIAPNANYRIDPFLSLKGNEYIFDSLTWITDIDDGALMHSHLPHPTFFILQETMKVFRQMFI